MEITDTAEKKHLSSQFDNELGHISASVMKLGGLVESQISQAARALAQLQLQAAEQVEALEQRVNRMEVDIDHELATIIARRQPTARDLRLLIVFSKVTANLERMGDEATRMARMVRSIIESGTAHSLPCADLRVAASLACALLCKALDALARLDTQAAVAVLREDALIDHEFDRFVRTLTTGMTGETRAIAASLDLLFIAKAIERIGDHCKNVAELVIYLVEGRDVRHMTLPGIESALAGGAETP